MLLLLKDSYGVDKGNGETLIDLRLTRDELAAIVGTATETAIRFVSELKEEKVISQDGKKIIILDEDKLIELANINY